MTHFLDKVPAFQLRKQAADRKISSDTGANWAGILAAILIGLAAALPLLGGRITEGADTLLHLFRLTQLDALFEGGIFFSRWMPDLAYGYGYPLFNYYAPGFYYLAQVPRLLGFSLPTAFSMTTIFLVLLASIGAYLWMADLVGRVGGLASAAAFTFTPYLMINVLHRGALAEVMALSLLPLLMWLFFRAVKRRRLIYRLAFALTFALLIASHNITALIISPILLLYLLILHVGLDKGLSQAEVIRQALTDAALLLVAVGLVTWYWLPALAEQDLVQLSRGTMLGDFRVENNFLSLAEIFAGPFFLDVKLVNLHFPLSLNLVVVLMALIGLVGVKSPWIRLADRLHIGLAATLSVILVIMMLPGSEPIWTNLPLIRFLQFPWRLLGPTNLFLALLAGYGLEFLRGRLKLQGRASIFLLAVAILAITVYALPWTYSEYLDLPEEVTLADSYRYEIDSGTLGTTSTGEYLPVHVQQLPTIPSQDDLPDGEKLDPTSLPDGAQIVNSTYSSLQYSLNVETDEPFTAIFKTFFFEGWEATLDGEQVLVRPTQPDGLLSVDIPAGKHALMVTFESTAVRRWGSAISVISLVLLIAVVLTTRRRRSTNADERKQPMSRVWYLPVAAILALVLYTSIRWLTLPPGNSPYDGRQVTAADRQLRVNYGDQLEIIGLNVPPEVSADQLLKTTLYWRALSPPETDYSVSLTLVDPTGNPVGQSDRQHIAGAPTSRWQLEKYARDDHFLSLAPGTPPGLYDLRVAVYHEGRPAERLNVLDEMGNPAGQVSTIDQVSVGRPEQAPSLGELAIPIPLTTDFGHGIRLLGAGLDRKEAWAGETIILDLFWQAGEVPLGDLTTSIWLVEDEGQMLELTRAPLVPGYPTSQWQSGDRWRGRHQILLPPSLTAGPYEIAVGQDMANLTQFGLLAVKAPDHIMTLPAVPVELDTSFDRVARLAGADLSGRIEAGQPVTVTLIWQAIGETQTNYRSFVQVLDQQGRFMAGSDQVPAGWQRPTTGWIRGEYIPDSHMLSLPKTLPPGRYRLIAGLYDGTNGQRLMSNDGGGSALIGEYAIR